MWIPRTRFANQEGEPSFTDRRLRIFPTGVVELITRTTAKYKTPIDVEKFPFDHQRLELDIRVVEDTTSTVALDYVQSDLDFTRAAKAMKLTGWNTSMVDLKRESIHGWNGDRYAQVTAALKISRLFGLNYLTLAFSLGVVLVLFRLNLPKRLFNAYVQEEIFRVCTWAIPLLALGTAAAILLIAAV